MDHRECETALIGLLLREPDALERVFASGCLPEMFERDDCRAIYSESLRLMAASQPIEVTTLGARLPDHLPTLLDCLEKAPVSQNIGFYAREVKLGHHSRRMAERLSLAARRLASRKPYSPADELRKVLAEVQSGVMFQEQEDGVVTTQQAGQELDRMTEAMLEGKGPRRVTTGLARLDQALQGGLLRGHFCVIGSRTGIGKTTLSCAISVAAARTGSRVLFATIEMSRTDLMQKLVSNCGNLHSDKFSQPGWSQADVDAFYRGLEEAMKLPIKIFDKTETSIERVIARARLEAKTDGLDLLVVDYIQQFRTARPHDIMRIEVAKVSAMLQQLAAELNIAMIVVAQIGRDGDDGIPRNKHLKECGNIEQDAGQILLMAPEKDEVGQETGNMHVAITKNRFGAAQGVMTFKKQFEYQRLVDDGRHS